MQRAQPITSCQEPGMTKWKVQKYWKAARGVEALKANKKPFIRLFSPNCCGRNILFRRFLKVNASLHECISTHLTTSSLQRKCREHALFFRPRADLERARGGRCANRQPSATGPAADGGGVVGRGKHREAAA